MKLDRSVEGLGSARANERPRLPRFGDEHGQAMVEFALVLVPLLILVVGIIQFGIGLNYWLDMQRVSNQGARFAVVNSWPGCELSDTAGACTNTVTCGTTITTSSNQSLLSYLKCQALTQGLRNSTTVTICYPNDGIVDNDGEVGSPVRVQLDTPYSFRAIMKLGTIRLRARSEMRLENNTKPSLPYGHLSSVGACP